MTPEGFISRASSFDPKQTMDRLAKAAVDNGMAIVARIDHAAAAKQAGMELRPTEVLIFGNPKGGTPVMQEAQTAAIDLPLKVLVWQDAEGTTSIGYNDPLWIGRRHGADGSVAPALQAMAAKLAAIVSAAAG